VQRTQPFRCSAGTMNYWCVTPQAAGADGRQRHRRWGWFRSWVNIRELRAAARSETEARTSSSFGSGVTRTVGEQHVVGQGCGGGFRGDAAAVQRCRNARVAWVASFETKTVDGVFRRSVIYGHEQIELLLGPRTCGRM
jgi:hypothetical protein